MKETEIKYLELKNGEKYPFLYSINVMKSIQNKYGSIEEWGNKIEPKDKKIEPDIEAIIFYYTEAINEGIDCENEYLAEKRPFISEKKAGRIITEIGYNTASKKLKESVVDANKTTNNLENENNDDIQKNQMTTQNQ